MADDFHGDAIAAARGVLPAALRPETDAGRGHRALMRDARRLAALLAADALSAEETGPALAAIEALVAAVRGLQTADGLFRGGDNVVSPPDSAFTIGDACDALTLLRGVADDALGAEADPAVRALGSIVRDAADALRTGGVHTPNHRWELCSALARTHALFPDARLVDRIDEWLAEGIDLDASGLYSERSPNYAAHVTNPALTTLARLLDRPELLAPVLRNLEATLDLIRPDGTVETVQSRRQDQGRPFPIADYLTAFRLGAVLTGRGDLARAALDAARGGVRDPDVLADALLDPRIDGPLPAADAALPFGFRVLESVGMTVVRRARTEAVVAAGCDYATQHRIRSGLANDPSFLRFFAGGVIVDAVRLSRRFFDLGPFRADGAEPVGDGGVRLQERVAGVYYGPLAPERRRPDGIYELEDEGRFSAAMDFASRPRTEVVLETSVTVTPVGGGSGGEGDAEGDDAEGVRLRVETTGPDTPLCLELVLREGTRIEGAELVREEDGRRFWLLTGREAVLRRDGAEVRVGPGGLGEPPFGEPGQDYTLLGGTDEPAGDRLCVVQRVPGAFELELRRTDAS